jgi:CP family cyanate transporter-like MFS transporter
MTLLMGLGISVSQPALPSVVSLWLPARVGLATAVYANGLLIGEIAAAALTVPLVLPLVGGSWELSFVAWSVPVLAAAALVAVATPHVARDASEPPARWWPDWRDGRTWSLAFIFGGASALYWGANAFIPDYLHATGRPGLVAAALTSLNVMQVPSSVLIAVFSRRLIGQRWPFVVAGSAMLLAVLAFLTMPGGWAIAWAGMFGLTAGGVLVLILAMPPLIAPDDVHRLSAGMFTVSYTCSFLGPLLGGAAWDATGLPWTAFLPSAVGALAVVSLPWTLRLDRDRR